MVAGAQRGTAVGTREGYASTFKPARERAYDKAYDEAYVTAYRDAFEQADLAAPQPREGERGHEPCRPRAMRSGRRASAGAGGWQPGPPGGLRDLRLLLRPRNRHHHIPDRQVRRRSAAAKRRDRAAGVPDFVRSGPRGRGSARQGGRGARGTASPASMPASAPALESASAGARRPPSARRRRSPSSRRSRLRWPPLPRAAAGQSRRRQRLRPFPRPRRHRHRHPRRHPPRADPAGTGAALLRCGWSPLLSEAASVRSRSATSSGPPAVGAGVGTGDLVRPLLVLVGEGEVDPLRDHPEPVGEILAELDLPLPLQPIAGEAGRELGTRTRPGYGDCNRRPLTSRPGGRNRGAQRG